MRAEGYEEFSSVMGMERAPSNDVSNNMQDKENEYLRCIGAMAGL
jgi:hypothetical protein